MDLAQLEIFRAVAEEGSITKASQRLHRVPSNVTTRLKQLEAELGQDLFIREKLRLHLSPTGAMFLDYAKRILDLASEAKRAVVSNEPHGVFALGSLESTAAVRIPALLASFHQKHPKVQLDLSTGSSAAMTERLVDGRLAAAFIDGPIRHPALEGKLAFTEQMIVVAPRGHRPISRANEVSGATVYAFRADCSYRKHFEKWFELDEVIPGKIFEMESYHGMLACVSAGAGIAMVPQSMLETMPGAGLVEAFPMQGDFGVVETWLTWRKGYMHPSVRALLAMLESHPLQNSSCLCASVDEFRPEAG